MGIALALAGFILRRQYVRARQHGFIGPRHRRIHRAEQRARFHLALATHAIGALVCFAGAFLCLTGTLHGL